METTEHKLPNYMLIWLYLFILTGAEVLFAFEMPISQLVKILCLMVLAVVKALLVALFFMHIKGSSRLLHLAATVGIIWLLIMLTLTLSDYFTRGWVPLNH